MANQLNQISYYIDTSWPYRYTSTSAEAFRSALEELLLETYPGIFISVEYHDARGELLLWGEKGLAIPTQAMHIRWEIEKLATELWELKWGLGDTY